MSGMPAQDSSRNGQVSSKQHAEEAIKSEARRRELAEMRCALIEERCLERKSLWSSTPMQNRIASRHALLEPDETLHKNPGMCYAAATECVRPIVVELSVEKHCTKGCPYIQHMT
eukprot:4950660-Amphidinium_carterae.1